MKRLIPALLLCLSAQVLGADEYVSEYIDVVGTPLQQDFKRLYREAYLAETDRVSYDSSFKSMSTGWVYRMEEFLEYAAFTPHHLCEEVEITYDPAVRHQDQIYVSFKCAVGEKSIEHVAVLSLGVKGRSYQYLVHFYWNTVLENNIWDD